MFHFFLHAFVILQVKGIVKGIHKVEDSILMKAATILGTPRGNICVGVLNETKEVTS